MIQCCPLERDNHPQCYPILVPIDDPFYAKWDENCLNFVRTAMCPKCRLGKHYCNCFLNYTPILGAIKST